MGMNAPSASAVSGSGWQRGPAGLLLLIVFLLAVPAFAASLQDAEALYAAGNYRAAALAGESLQTADGLALAARARLVRAAYLLPRDRAVEELHQAEDLARQALAKNPEQTEAALNLAIALGYRARIEGYVGAFFNGLAKEAKRMITRALEEAPESGWAQVVDGAWNAEIVIGAGPGLAKTLYGASRAEALERYRTAVKLDPDNPTIRFEYAKALIKLEGKDGWAQAGEQLDRAIAAPSRNKFTDLMQTQAKTLKAALDGGDEEMIATRLQQIDPFSKG